MNFLIKKIVFLEPIREVLNRDDNKKRGVFYEKLVDKGKPKSQYARSELKLWVPPDIVPENIGYAGEMGKPVRTNPGEELLMKELFKINQFNLLASDKISFNRSLPDVRAPG